MHVHGTRRPGSRPGRPRLAGGWELRLTAGGDLYLLRDWGGEDLLVEGDGAYVAELLRAADGTRTAEEALRIAGAAHAPPADGADACLGLLAELGVVEDAALDRPGLAPRDEERFDRQLAYFAQRLRDGATRTDPQLRLRDATICILGLGGLGSWTALALATCGVGGIVGVDGDTVELSNLNRQVLYAETDIGAPKAGAAGRILRAYDSALRYEPRVARLRSAADVRAAVAGADAVVAAADWPPHLIDRWTSQACFGLGIPYIAMSQQPPLVRVGPLYVPGVTGCHACEEAGFRDEHPGYDALVDTVSPFATTATFGPACAVVGGLAASELAHHLAGIGPVATQGRSLLVDLAAGTSTPREVVRRPDCPVCARPGATRRP
jgi:bacteriocin biosynthesis cyclodehydratase domain-containing protein